MLLTRGPVEGRNPPGVQVTGRQPSRFAASTVQGAGVGRAGAGPGATLLQPRGATQPVAGGSTAVAESDPVASLKERR